MRVLHLTDNMMPGGLQRIILTLANYSTSIDQISVGVVASKDGALWEELELEVERIFAPPRRTIISTVLYAFWLRMLVKRDGWNIVHAHQRGVALIARVALWGTSARIVEHVHNVFANKGMKGLISFRGHQLIACGTAVQDMLLHDFGRQPKKISLIRNSVIDSGEMHDLALPCGNSNYPLRMLGVGRLTAQKDPLRFVAVAEHLNRGDHRIAAEWVGGGELKATVEAEIDRCPNVGDFKLEGFSSDVAHKLRESDFILITSRWEGLPLVALEALANGRGVIAPDVGSCRDVVKPGINGYLFDVVSSPSEIAEHIEEFLNAETLCQWGKASRLLFEAEGGVDAMISSTVAVYRKALKGDV